MLKIQKFLKKSPNTGEKKKTEASNVLKGLKPKKTEPMLKNILNLEGTQELTANEQKMIIASNVKEASPRCEAWINDEDCAAQSLVEIKNGN